MKLTKCFYKRHMCLKVDLDNCYISLKKFAICGKNFGGYGKIIVVRLYYLYAPFFRSLTSISFPQIVDRLFPPLLSFLLSFFSFIFITTTFSIYQAKFAEIFIFIFLISPVFHNVIPLLGYSLISNY